MSQLLKQAFFSSAKVRTGVYAFPSGSQKYQAFTQLCVRAIVYGLQGVCVGGRNSMWCPPNLV